MSTLHNPYERYWATVEEILGRDPRHRSTAIALSGSAAERWDATRNTKALFDALDGPFWGQPATRIASNWMWRDTVPPAAIGNIEVGIERRVAELGGPDDWTCQMPTLSGFISPRANKRRSIDLVQRTGPYAFRFIELKVESDNPLYAVFELLGYGLTYLHAMRRRLHGAGRHNVLSARSLELLVLAPEDWYWFRKTGVAEPCKFDFSWLAHSTAGAMTDLAASVEVHIRFDSYVWTGDIGEAAVDIGKRIAS